MKTKQIIILGGLVLVFLTLSGFKNQERLHVDLMTIEAQESLVVYATYDGKEDYGYNFITQDEDEDGEERTLTFQVVKDEVLNVFDLSKETFVGTKFKITFNSDLKVTIDENGMEDEEETNTIIKLEKL